MEVKTVGDWVFYLSMWAVISVIAGAQGWYTGEAVMTVLGWLGH